MIAVPSRSEFGPSKPGPSKSGPSKSKSPSASRRLLERYLEGLALERGLAANTVAAYCRDLEGLIKHLEGRRIDLLSVDYQHLAAYTRHLRTRNVAPSSVRRAVVSL